MNPLVPTVLDGVLTAVAIGALIFALAAFVSLVRSASTVGWWFAAWTLVVFVVPIVGPTAWFMTRRRGRMVGSGRGRVGS